jgi:tetratricopeptide (TPR) repeat protein
MPENDNRAHGAEDYSDCPIPKTHRRLVEAHLLWHQALEQYQNPEAFRANLNATIQALRNVTFILQSEKGAFGAFDDWYTPWQDRLRADPISKWSLGARNLIVKQGELETHSTAIAKLVTWRDHVLAELSVPADMPPSLILSNLPLVELIANRKIPAGDVKTAAILIERRWSVPDLDGREILDALAQAYGLLSEVVLDAHMRLGNSACVPADPAHTHFVSASDRTGTLRCMAAGIESRMHRFELATGQQLEPRLLDAPVARETAVAAANRYGLGEGDLTAEWQNADPLGMAEKLLFLAKRMLRKDRAHIRTMFVRDGRGQWHQVRLQAANRAQKHLLMRMVARFVESVGGDAVIDVSEAWLLPPEAVRTPADLDRIDSIRGRKEMLWLFVGTRAGFLRTYCTPFTRGSLGGIKLGDTFQSHDKYWPSYMAPVVEVWRKQGYAIPPGNGERIRRIWGPDPLENCYCGRPKRFGECCKRFLTSEFMEKIEEEIHKTREAGDPAHAERLASAALAQYVIWIKQHTADTRQVASDLFRMLLEVDAPALQAHLRRVGELLAAIGRSDSFVPRTRQISRVVGVPELSERLIALGAEWLLKSGDYAGAAKELERLGDLDRVDDTIALLLAARLLNLPGDQALQFLRKAASRALTKEEKRVAELELARHLFKSGNQAEALRAADSVISESLNSDGGRDPEGLFLRWELTGNEHDFRAARKEVEVLADAEHRLAGMLIDHGDYDEAERVLSDCLAASEPSAQLLAIDARMHAGRTDAARELLLRVDRAHLPPGLRYPFALDLSHVAIACDDRELKGLATAELRELRSAGTQVQKTVDDLLQALSDSGTLPREPLLLRLGDLLGRWTARRDA